MGSGDFRGVAWVLGVVRRGAWVLGPKGPEGKRMRAAGAKILGFRRFRTQIFNRKMSSQTAISEKRGFYHRLAILLKPGVIGYYLLIGPTRGRGGVPKS